MAWACLSATMLCLQVSVLCPHATMLCSLLCPHVSVLCPLRTELQLPVKCPKSVQHRQFKTKCLNDQTLNCCSGPSKNYVITIIKYKHKQSAMPGNLSPNVAINQLGGSDCTQANSLTGRRIMVIIMVIIIMLSLTWLKNFKTFF